MKLTPHESDHWNEFDLSAALAKLLAEHHVTAEELLLAAVHTLVDNYREERLAYPGEMPVTLLVGFELLVAQQYNRNLEIYQQEAGDDAPEDGDFVDGMICSQRADQQAALSDLLCACIKAVGAEPIRNAA